MRTPVDTVRNPVRSLFLWPIFHQIPACRFAAVYRQEPFEHIRGWSHDNGWCRSPLARAANILPQCSLSPARFVLFLHWLTVFIGNCMYAELQFLGAPSTKTESAFRQGVVFFCLRPGEVVHFRFSFSNPFSREVCNNLAQPIEIDKLKRALVEEFSNKFPSRSSVHQSAQMPVSVST